MSILHTQNSLKFDEQFTKKLSNFWEFVPFGGVYLRNCKRHDYKMFLIQLLQRIKPHQNWTKNCYSINLQIIWNLITWLKLGEK